MIEYTTLGNLIAPAKVIRCGKGSFPVLSMTMHDGIVLQSERFKKSLASIDQSDYKVVKRGQLVVGFPIDEGVLYVQKAADEGIMSPAYNVWDIDTEKVDADFLELCLHSPQSMQYYKDKLRGTTARRRSIPTADLLALKIRLPDMQTQREAVAIMRKAEAVIAARQEQMNYFEQLVKSRFIELFGEETEFDKWHCCTIGDVADVCVGVVIKPTQYYTDKGIPAFRSLNIGEMRVKDADWVYFTEEGHHKNQKSVIRKNDVLVVRSGAPGTACVATEKYDGYNAVDIIIAHPDNRKVDSVFLAAFTNMPHGMNQIRSKTGGAAQQHFNVGGYKAMRLIMPPMELQKQFAAFVEQTDKSKLAVQKGLQELEILKKSLMQQYFG